jgi:Mn-dependent DtxR family transcriptional regulator
MYLETILLLRERMATVRSIDVVEEMGYAKSSVSRAVNLLHKKGLVAIDGNGDITLTPSGLSKAQNIYDRHRVITKVLEAIGADEQMAEENACRIEHVISEELFNILKQFAEKA